DIAGSSGYLWLATCAGRVLWFLGSGGTRNVPADGAGSFNNPTRERGPPGKSLTASPDPWARPACEGTRPNGHTDKETHMDRREWLGVLGAGVGVSLGGMPVHGDEHGQAKPDDRRLMAPVHELHAHFCGIHIAKSNPKFQ